MFINIWIVGSGSEDKKGYLWHRYYKCQVSQLPHQEVVSCVAIRPGQENTCVTCSDDYAVRVWKSKKFMREKKNTAKKDFKF